MRHSLKRAGKAARESAKERGESRGVEVAEGVWLYVANARRAAFVDAFTRALAPIEGEPDPSSVFVQAESFTLQIERAQAEAAIKAWGAMDVDG